MDTGKCKTTYRGKRFRFGGGPYVRRRIVAAILDRYPLGASVLVRYNPLSPSDCVLDTHFEWLSHLPIIFMAVAILAPTAYHLFVDGPLSGNFQP